MRTVICLLSLAIVGCPTNSADVDTGGDAPIDVATSDAGGPEMDAPFTDAPTGRLVCRGFFCDDFEYDVSRDADDADTVFRVHGWPAAKANNTTAARGDGYLFTRFEEMIHSRALVLESLPSESEIVPGLMGQTDYYLQYGGERLVVHVGLRWVRDAHRARRRPVPRGTG